MKKLEVHASPLTGTIFAGVPLKGGIWGKNKHDVTMDALFAVASHVIIAHEGIVELSTQDDNGNKKSVYKITVEELSE